MKNLRILLIITLLLMLPLVLGFQDCNNNKPDDSVTITYQHLANFQSYKLQKDGKLPGDFAESGTGFGMWHVYMLRGVINNRPGARAFIFDVTKLLTKDGANVNSQSQAMVTALPETMPIDFRVNVPPGTAFTIPFGTGELFFILQQDDWEQTALTQLHYKVNIGTADQPGDQPVTMFMLDAKEPVEYGQLDQDFLNKIHARQNDFDYKYTPEGAKK